MTRILTSEEETAALPSGSVVVLHRAERKRVRTALYKTYFGGTWSELDPTDRDDGANPYPKSALWTIATLRDKMTPELVWAPDFDVVAVDPLALPTLPHGAVVLIVRGAGDQQTTDVFQLSHGTWTDMDPGDRYDGEYAISDIELVAQAQSTGGTLVLVWTPPES